MDFEERISALLWYGSMTWEISASFHELQQSYISGYGKVLFRIWNGAEGLLCLVGGMISINPYMLFQFTVLDLVQESLFTP